LCQLVVVEQFAVFVGHDELVVRFAIRDREAVLLIVFHQTDDFVLGLLAVGRLDDDNVFEFDLALFAAGLAILSVDIEPP